MIRSIEFRAMNTDVLLAAEGERAVQGMQVVMAFIHDCEQRFSRFLPASELSALNRSVGEWLPVSTDLMDMLVLSMSYYLETHGLFDPSILPELKQMGYDRSMDQILAEGRRVEQRKPLRESQPAFNELLFDLVNSRVFLPTGMEIDLGGIAKGWIVEEAAHLLNTYVETCAVSAGGDALFIGHPSDGRDWDVYLEDPRDPMNMLAQLHLDSGAVATSSIKKRTWRQGEAVRHHLIDPRTGESAKTDWLSVTVIAKDIITADIFAKALLIGGEGEAQKVLEARPGLTYIVVDPDGNLTGSPDYKEFMYESATITNQPMAAPY